MPSRVRTRAECERLLEITEPLEPRTQSINARLLQGPSRSRRIYVAEREGDVIGVAVVSRRYLDRWGAYTLLLDEAAAEPLARIIDRSPARDVAGVEGDVGPLQPHLRRARKLDHLLWSVVDLGTPFPEYEEVEARARRATRADVKGLAALYAEYPYIDAPTLVQLRRMLRRSIDQGLMFLVVEADGKIVAANRMESRGCRYGRWTDLVVDPAYRGRGYHHAIDREFNQLLPELGVGMVAETAPSMRVRELLAKRPTDWEPRGGFEVLHLDLPRRFPGQGHLRRALYALGGRRTRRAEP